ncbi:MAG: WecB/TagA/CpsF family glycosyltransferase [Sedimentisphaerales bacterium]|nr:WecB/TagA/CpsF family glycosyltransferase [Sedimentisphaerales bacterium]
MGLLAEYPKVRLMGVDVFALRMSEVLDICNEHIAERRRLLIGVVNVAKVVNARKDPKLSEALDQADIVLADGAPIVWLSRMLGRALPERVAGIDIMYELLKEADKRHYGVYFLGARPEVVQEVVRVIGKDYPGLRVAGYRDGYFNEQEEQVVAEAIKNSQADILFVAITPPKKEIFLGKWRQFMNVPVCHGVGGSFDIVAGATKRAPAWMRNHGLEWLYRIIQEPRRMWKRYLVTNTKFILLCICEISKSVFTRIFRRDRRDIEGESKGSEDATSVQD